MPTEDRREVKPGRDQWARSPQSTHWHDIGISAVAAAARYANAPAPAKTITDTAASGPETNAPKIVTLRDIELFSA